MSENNSLGMSAFFEDNLSRRFGSNATYGRTLFEKSKARVGREAVFIENLVGWRYHSVLDRIRVSIAAPLGETVIRPILTAKALFGTQVSYEYMKKACFEQYGIRYNPIFGLVLWGIYSLPIS